MYNNIFFISTRYLFSCFRKLLILLTFYYIFYYSYFSLPVLAAAPDILITPNLLIIAIELLIYIIPRPLFYISYIHFSYRALLSIYLYILLRTASVFVLANNPFSSNILYSFFPLFSLNFLSSLQLQTSHLYNSFPFFYNNKSPIMS